MWILDCGLIRGSMLFFNPQSEFRNPKLKEGEANPIVMSDAMDCQSEFRNPQSSGFA
jgi:hypothetical protein